ncbi:MAG: hypothetical protein ACYS47_07885 [Planctomycetota bacterium]|jgi:hypothetical protein
MGKNGTLVLLVLAVLLLRPAPARADFGPLGPDARALGKGGAYTAEAEGPSAVYWNPAGIGLLSGVHAALSYGTLQRPDFGSNDFGNTDRIFLGASFGTGEEGKPGFLGLGAAIEKPFPRFDYAGVGRIASGASATPRRLSATSSQDYLEFLAAVGVRAFQTDLLGGKGRLHVGLSLGVGFSSNHVKASVVSLSGPLVSETADESGQELLIPASLGALFSLEGKSVRFSFGVRYRAVLSSSEADWVSFPQSKVDLTSADLFMAPPQEGAVAVSLMFFERLLYSLELSYLFFDAPDAFPNVVPHNYPTVKFGFEYRIPFAEGRRRIAVRFGVTNSFPGTDQDSTVYTTGSTGVHFGWGLHLGPLARIDAYFTLQIPGEGDVDEDTFLASLSYGVKF